MAEIQLGIWPGAAVAKGFALGASARSGSQSFAKPQINPALNVQIVGSCHSRCVALRLPRPLTRSRLWCLWLAPWLLFSFACRAEPSLVEQASEGPPLQDDTEAIKAAVDDLQQRIEQLEATQFSSVTTLRGELSSVLGNLQTYGSVVDRATNQALNQPLRNGVSFNYDLKLYVDTSFTGHDRLHIRLRSGNFQPSAFWFSEPTPLTRIQVGWESKPCSSGDPISCSRNLVMLNRAYYQFPISEEWRATFGARVLQVDLLPLFPSVYDDAKILQLFQFAGAQGAYSRRLGPGLGLAWKPKGALQGFSLGLASIQNQGSVGDPDEGGVLGRQSAQTNTVQLAYTRKRWNVTATYTANGTPARLRGTPLANTLTGDSTDGWVNSWGLAGYWQPVRSGWIPSVSAGVGFDALQFSQFSLPEVTTAQTSSWMVGLVWTDLLAPGNSLGMAVGSPNSVSLLKGKGISGVDDSLLAAEAYYRIQLTDHIQLIPAIFWINRPRGAMTATTSADQAVLQPELNNAASLGVFGSILQLVVRF